MTHTLAMTAKCGIMTAFGTPVVPEENERSASRVRASSGLIETLGGSGLLRVDEMRSSMVGKPDASDLVLAGDSPASRRHKRMEEAETDKSTHWADG